MHQSGHDLKMRYTRYDFKVLYFDYIKTTTRRSTTMLETWVLVFAMTAFFISFLFRRMDDFQLNKVASSLTAIAWSCLLFGLYLTKGLIR